MVHPRRPQLTDHRFQQEAEKGGSISFTWSLDNFSRLKYNFYSDVFWFDHYKWRLTVFPKGDNVDYLSMYVDVANSANLPNGWSRCARFSLAVINQNNDEHTVRKAGKHKFNALERVSGYTYFMPLGELYDPARGFVVDDTCEVEVTVDVRSVMDNSAYNYKKVTHHKPTIKNDFPSRSILPQSSFLSSKLTEAEQAGEPNDFPSRSTLPQSSFLSSKLTEAEQAGEPNDFPSRSTLPQSSFLSSKLTEAEQAGEPNDFPSRSTLPQSSFLSRKLTEAEQAGEPNDFPSGSTLRQSSFLSSKLTEAEQAGVPVTDMATIEKMDSVMASMPKLEAQTDLDRKINLRFTEVICAAPMTCKAAKPTPTTQSGEMASSPKYPGSGQLFEEGRHCKSLDDEKFEDIGGFAVLKTQASLYKQIWLKYGHIASGQVLKASYIGQVTMVSEIMKAIMEMHQRHQLSSAMIDTWEEKIKMAEKLEFNIKWLQLRFEDIKKDFFGMQKLWTELSGQMQSLMAAHGGLITVDDELKKAEARLTAAKDESKKAHENTYALATRIKPQLKINYTWAA